MTFPMTVVDTVFKAMAPAIPDRIIAGHHADLVVGRVNGRRPRDDSFYIYLGGLIGGGWGAKHDSDGRNATIAMNDGDTEAATRADDDVVFEVAPASEPALRDGDGAEIVLQNCVDPEAVLQGFRHRHFLPVRHKGIVEAEAEVWINDAWRSDPNAKERTGCILLQGFDRTFYFF